MILSSIWNLPKTSPDEIAKHEQLARALEEGRRSIKELREAFQVERDWEEEEAGARDGLELDGLDGGEGDWQDDKE